MAFKELLIPISIALIIPLVFTITAVIPILLTRTKKRSIRKRFARNSK